LSEKAEDAIKRDDRDESIETKVIKKNDNWLGTEKMKIRITIRTAEDSTDYRKRA
jgi:hypothetical protein